MGNRFICLAAVLSAVMTVHGLSRDPPKIQWRLSGGYARLFEDHHAAVGTGLRVALTPRVSLEAELRLMGQAFGDDNFLVTGNLIYDLRSSSGAVPYLIGSMGVIHSRRSSLFGHETWTRTDITASGGGGVRFYLGRRVFIGLEGRIGHDPLVYSAANVGFVLK